MDTKRKMLSVPHYQKIADVIVDEVRDGLLKPGDALPSLNQTAATFKISRDTALAAYKKLKQRGLVKAIPGKGYFLTANDTETFYNVFLLFDELNSFKEDLYNSFVEMLGKNARVDIFFHHFNVNTFRQLVNTCVGNYSHYVVMPTQFEEAKNILAVLPSQRTYILDQSNYELNELYASVYQNFEKDTYQALLSAEAQLCLYEKLILIHPGGKEPLGQKRGFENYCNTHNKRYEILEDLSSLRLEKDSAYITPSDRFLVILVKKAREKSWKLGKDLGIISFNDTPLKEVVEEGITTISTDFPQMGMHLADLIKKNKKANIENPSALILRKSI